MWIRCSKCEHLQKVDDTDPAAEIRCPKCDVYMGRVGENHTKVYDPIEVRRIKKLFEHRRSVRSLVFSQDGKLLVSGGEDGAIWIWNIEVDKHIQKLNLPKVEVHCVALSPDGLTLASGGSDEIIRLWDVATGKEKARLVGHGQEVYALSFSPDGRYLASGSANPGGGRLDWGKLLLWDLATGKSLDTPRIDACNCRALTFSPDGKTLAALRDSHLLTFIDMTTGESVKAAEKQDLGPNSLAFLPDGSTLVSAGSNGLKLWDPATGQLKGVIFTRPRHYAGFLFSAECVAVSPDGKLLAVGIDVSGASIEILDVAPTGKARALLDVGDSVVRAVAFSPQGTLLATGAGKRVALWRICDHVMERRPAGA